MKFKVVGNIIVRLKDVCVCDVIKGEKNYNSIVVEAPLRQEETDLSEMEFTFTAVPAGSSEGGVVKAAEKQPDGDKLILSVKVSSDLSSMEEGFYFSLKGRDGSGNVIAEFMCLERINVGDPETYAASMGTFGGGGSNAYFIPTASATVKGGIRIDDKTLSVENGVLSASNLGGLTHNLIYRGSDITEAYDSGEFSAHVADGSFDDIFMGDYIQKSVTVDGTTYNVKGYVVDCDTFYSNQTVGSLINTHHTGMVVTGLPNHSMNPTATSENGYSGSGMHAWLTETVLPELERVFGAEHILSHTKMLSTAINISMANGTGVSNGAASARNNFETKISLLSESQIGGKASGSSMFDVGEAYRQLSLFRIVNISFIIGGKSLWLRDVGNKTSFAARYGSGSVAVISANSELTPCPLILLK